MHRVGLLRRKVEEEKHTGWLVFLFLSGDHSLMFFLIWLFILVFLILDVLVVGAGLHFASSSSSSSSSSP
jgi:hypothetical protein